MEYQRYIDLGFERTNMSCNVEFKQTRNHTDQRNPLVPEQYNECA